MSSRICQVCSQTEGWHIQHRPMHSFVAEGEAPRLAETPPPPQPVMNMRGDPVLRLALLKAGVITEQNLGEAEVWLRQAAEQNLAVVYEGETFKLVSIEDWIKHTADAK